MAYILVSWTNQPSGCIQMQLSAKLTYFLLVESYDYDTTQCILNCFQPS